MAYWGPQPADNDYAFTDVSIAVNRIKEILFGGMPKVVEKSYPEQSMVSLLRCIRMIHKEFPKAVRFSNKEFEAVKAGFAEWYGRVSDKIPAKYRHAILESAESEFAAFGSEVLERNPVG